MPNLFKTRTMALDVATPTQGVEFNIPGHLFQVVDVSAASVKIEVQIDDRNGEWAELREGMGWEHQKYKTLWMRWDAQPGQTISVAWGGNPADADRSRLRLLTASAQSSVTVDNSTPIEVEVSNPLALTEFASPTSEASVFSVHKATTAVASVTLASIVSAGPTPMDTVPAGKELLIMHAAGGANDTKGGVLILHIAPNQDLLHVPLIYQQTVLPGLIGMVCPEGSKFRLKSLNVTATYSVWAGICGILRDV